MPGRKHAAGSGYRYGFNGKEDDIDINIGDQDCGMRIYDVRLCRFLSLDPLAAEYPMLTLYQFASNRPVDGIDIDGREWGKVANWLFPIAGMATDKDVRNGFAKRATEFIQGFKALPGALKKIAQSVNTTTALPGMFYLEEKSKKEAAMINAVG